MKEIPLSKGYVAVVDDEDYDRVTQYKWHADVAVYKRGGIRTVYAKRNRNAKCQIALLHRFILDVTDGKIDVDHINGNGLDCRRSNLRIATRTQNNGNSAHKGGSSRYKGVYWDTQRGKWAAQIQLNGKSRYIGRYDDEDEAGRAYAAAAKKVFGEFANPCEAKG